MISPATPATSLPEKQPSGRSYAREGRSRRPNVFQVAAMILCLAFLAAGLLFVFDKDPTRGAMAVTCFLLPAAIYILGWFYYMPESLGASSRNPRPLQERWTSWLRASGFLGLACLLGWGVVGIVESDSITETSIFFACGAAIAYCVAVVMVLLRRHFAPEDGLVGSIQGAARRRWIEVFEKIGAPARHLATRLSPRVSLPSGSAMILASVLLLTSVDGCHSYRGYEVLQGKAAWLTAENMDHKTSKAVGTVAAYANYCLGLASALAIVAVVVVRLRRGVSIRPSTARCLVLTTGVVALFTISDLALFFLAQHRPILYCLMFLLYWVAPITVWLYYTFSGKARERWSIVRSSLIILYLPVLFWSYGTLIFVAVLGVYGYLSYFLGIQLAWWGCIQVAPAIASRSTPVGSAGGTGEVKKLPANAVAMRGMRFSVLLLATLPLQDRVKAPRIKLIAGTGRCFLAEVRRFQECLTHPA